MNILHLLINFCRRIKGIEEVGKYLSKCELLGLLLSKNISSCIYLKKIEDKEWKDIDDIVVFLNAGKTELEIESYLCNK
jgi:hypothetical protein